MTPPHQKRELGIVGLGLIGGGLAHQALRKGFRVVGLDTRGASPRLRDAGLEEIGELKQFRQALAAPRIILLYIPAGDAVDQVTVELAPHLQPGDIIVDGGNSYWGDSIRRQQRLSSEQIHFLDVGTSGGVAGAHEGACFMAGGDAEAVATVEPVLRSLAVEGGFVHAGPPGAGHFVKLVHNGIEFGMLQAIGEGIAILKKYDHPLDLLSILGAWRNGSVIRSWLIELMHEQLLAGGELDEVPPYVEDTGEVNWLVGDAMKMEVEVPVIAAAVMQLFASRSEQQDWARAIALMRHGFGDHPLGQDRDIARERQEGRVGPIT